MTYPTKFPRTVREIPADTLFILLENTSYSEAGYDPGDSYTRVDAVNVLTFSSEELMKTYVTEQLTTNSWRTAKSPLDFKVIPYNPLKIETKTVITM